MNYTTITINGEEIGLKFGMASFRYLTDKFVDGVSFNENMINEIGISHIIYGGYYNHCLIKNEKPKYNFEYIVDYIESNLKNQKVLQELQEVIKVWSDSDIIKDATEDDFTKKKKSRGKK